MPYDYSDAPPPQFEVIPHGTTATFVLHIRAGNVGEDGMLTRSKDGGCEMLVGELTIADGPYKGRKLFESAGSWPAPPMATPSPRTSTAAHSRRFWTARLGSSPTT